MDNRTVGKESVDNRENDLEIAHAREQGTQNIQRQEVEVGGSKRQHREEASVSQETSEPSTSELYSGVIKVCHEHCLLEGRTNALQNITEFCAAAVAQKIEVEDSKPKHKKSSDSPQTSTSELCCKVAQVIPLGHGKRQHEQETYDSDLNAYADGREKVCEEYMEETEEYMEETEEYYDNNGSGKDSSKSKRNADIVAKCMSIFRKMDPKRHTTPSRDKGPIILLEEETPVGSDAKMNTEAEILRMPELILEQIFRNLSLKDLCHNVRPTCRLFYHVVSRILRLVFRNIAPRLEGAMKNVEDMPLDNQWSRVCTGYLTYKLLQSELMTLRAACARQVESGLWCFIPGQTLEEYTRLISAIQDDRISRILDGISDTLVNINKPALDCFDSRYEMCPSAFSLQDMKLFGVEVLEILNTAMNASCSMTVNYSSGSSGSCFIAGRIGIAHCTELKSPPLKRSSLSTHRKAMLMYLRYLVRANNCDIVLRKLREWNQVNKTGGSLPSPILGTPQWKLQDRFNILGNYIQEVYKREAVDESPNTDWLAQYSDCNVIMDCTFELKCPKFMNPLGIEFQTTDQIVKNDSYTYMMANEVLTMVFKHWEQNQIISELNGDVYSFNLSLKFKHTEAVLLGKPREEHINITEAYITTSAGHKECCLKITGNRIFEA